MTESHISSHHKIGTQVCGLPWPLIENSLSADRSDLTWTLAGCCWLPFVGVFFFNGPDQPITDYRGKNLRQISKPTLLTGTEFCHLKISSGDLPGAAEGLALKPQDHIKGLGGQRPRAHWPATCSTPLSLSKASWNGILFAFIRLIHTRIIFLAS